MRKENISRLADYKKINKFHPDYLVYFYLIRDLEFAINTYAKGKVLDIGCGNKPYESAFEGKITGYTGCDIIQSDQNKADIICEATKIPLPAESFDTIFSSQTIEHVADYQSMITEAFRLLNPGGYFILSGPMYWHLHEEPHDYFRFTKHGYEYILTKAGFKIEKVLPNGGMWAVSGQSFLHSLAFGNTKFFLTRIWRFIFFKLRMQWIFNTFYQWLDRKDYNAISTLNYVIIAYKKG